MTNTELDVVAARIRELNYEIDQLNAELEACKDQLKQEMYLRGVEVLAGSSFKATWITVTTDRLDTKRLKAEQPELYSKYIKTTCTTRFNLK